MSSRLVRMAGVHIGTYIPKDGSNASVEYERYVDNKDYVHSDVQVHKAWQRTRSHTRGFIGDSQG